MISLCLDLTTWDPFIPSIGYPLSLAPCPRAVGGTPSSSSSSPPPLQLSIFQLSPKPSPPLHFLSSELHAQPDITLPLPQVEVEAAAPSCASTASLATVFPESQHHFVKYWNRQGKT